MSPRIVLSLSLSLSLVRSEIRGGCTLAKVGASVRKVIRHWSSTNALSILFKKAALVLYISTLITQLPLSLSPRISLKKVTLPPCFHMITSLATWFKPNFSSALLKPVVDEHTAPFFATPILDLLRRELSWIYSSLTSLFLLVTPTKLFAIYTNDCLFVVIIIFRASGRYCPHLAWRRWCRDLRAPTQTALQYPLQSEPTVGHWRWSFSRMHSTPFALECVSLLFLVLVNRWKVSCVDQ